MHRWPRSTHQVAVDAPHNLGRYSTGSFTTVQSWDQAGPTCALSRSRSQERRRTEASDRRTGRRGSRYPRPTGLPSRSAKRGILTSRHLSFRPKKKVRLKAESSPDTTQPLGAPRSVMRASLSGVKNELTSVHRLIGALFKGLRLPLLRGSGRLRQNRLWRAGRAREKCTSITPVRST